MPAFRTISRVAGPRTVARHPENRAGGYYRTRLKQPTGRSPDGVGGQEVYLPAASLRFPFRAPVAPPSPSGPLRSVTCRKSAPFRAGQAAYPAGYGFPLPFGCRRSLPPTSLTRRGIRPPSRSAYRGLGPGLRRAYHVPQVGDTTGVGALFTA